MPENEPQAEPQPESYILPGKGLKDARMERRALRSRWGVKDEYKQAILKRVVENGLASDTSPRDATQALRALIAAEQQDYEKDRADAGGETVNVNLSGEVKQKHEHDHLAKLAGFLAQYDAEMARSAGLPPGVRPSADQPVDEAGTNGQANGVPGH